MEYRYIEPKVGNILYPGCNICRCFTRKGFEYLVYYIGGNYCIPSDVPIHHAQYQGWNIGVEHRNIFPPPPRLVRFTRLCNKISIGYTISKCGLCAHIITLEFSVIPEANMMDKRKRESHIERITHTSI